MTLTKYRCEHCFKETEDPLDETGWITISSFGERAVDIVRTKGPRDTTRAATTYNKSSPRFDFCCMACLSNYMHPAIQFPPK